MKHQCKQNLTFISHEQLQYLQSQRNPQSTHNSATIAQRTCRRIQNQSNTCSPTQISKHYSSCLAQKYSLKSILFGVLGYLAQSLSVVRAIILLNGHHRQGHFFILHISFFFILSLLLLLCLSLHLRLIVLQGPHLLWPNVSIILSKGSPHQRAFIFVVSSSTSKNISSYYNDGFLYYYFIINT